MRLSYSQQALVGGGRVPALAAPLQQPLPVLVIPEDRLPPVVPIHDIMNRPKILDAQLPSHAPKLMSPLIWGQENMTISLTDLGLRALVCLLFEK